MSGLYSRHGLQSLATPQCAADNPEAADHHRPCGRLCASFISLSAFMLTVPALAQITGSVTIVTDYRLRGLSLNGQRPAIIVEAGYDDPSGAYAGAAVAGGDTRAFNGQILSNSQYIGFAKELKPSVSIDVGVQRTQIFSNVATQFSGSYAEVYVGLTAGNASARVAFSPSFITPALRTAYLEVANTFPVGRRTRLFGHISILAPLGRGKTAVPEARYDIRAGVAHQIKNVEVQLLWSHSGASDSYLRPRQQRRDALVASTSWFF